MLEAYLVPVRISVSQRIRGQAFLSDFVFHVRFSGLNSKDSYLPEQTVPRADFTTCSNALRPCHQRYRTVFALRRARRSMYDLETQSYMSSVFTSHQAKSLPSFRSGDMNELRKPTRVYGGGGDSDVNGECGGGAADRTSGGAPLEAEDRSRGGPCASGRWLEISTVEPELVQLLLWTAK